MSVSYSNPGLVWQPLGLPGPERLLVIHRMEEILESWRGTKYMSGQDCRGAHADCLGFTFRVVDELYRRPTAARPSLPPDTSMHDRKSAIRTVRKLRRLYMPNVLVRDGSVEPGDILVTAGPNGGPGHAMIVGPRRNTLWHCNPGTGVCQTGLALAEDFQQVAGVYRFTDKERWA